MHPTASALVRWLGIEPGWPGRVVVSSGAVVVLCVDDREPPSPIEGADRIDLISRRGWWRRDPRVVRYTDWDAYASSRARREPSDACAQAVVHSLEAASWSAVWRLVRIGVRHFHFTYAAGASFSAPRRTACLLGLAGSFRRLSRRATGSITSHAALAGWTLGVDPHSRQAVRAAFVHAIRMRRERAAAARASSPASVPPLDVVHYISDLSPGGAERQLVALASAQHARGLRVLVCTALPLEGSSGHFATALAASGVAIAAVPARRRMGPRRALAREIAAQLPVGLPDALEAHAASHRLVPLVEALNHTPPAVLHCWLDEPNAVGSLAGVIVGVPRIVLSTRNLSPRHLPRLCRTWYRASYRLAARSSTVRLIANSAAGASDYAHWCGIDRRVIRVIPNGIDTNRLRPATSDDRAALRAQLGVPSDGFLLASIHRLTAEKRPSDFVEAFARLRQRIPNARAFHIGSGPEEAHLRARAAELGVGSTLRFLGRIPDPERWLAVADACLLTSAFEGCPNVPLESQALAVPTIVTDGGGSPEVVLPGETGFVCGVGDVNAMVDRLAELAASCERREAMGRRGRTFVCERFSIERMVADTLAAYR